MRLSPSPCCVATLLVSLPSAAVALHAQTFAAIRTTTPAFAGDLPSHEPSALPPHHKKTDAPLLYARVRDGVYSVDGLVGKVRLNYDVNAANYLYLFMPGVGTALVSLAPMADAMSVPVPYGGSQLTVHVADHTFNVTGVESLVDDRGKQPAVLFVSLDRSAWRLGHTPMLGFGNTSQAPYQWPGALPNLAEAPATDEAPVPVPASLLPRLAASTPAKGTR